MCVTASMMALALLVAGCAQVSENVTHDRTSPASGSTDGTTAQETTTDSLFDERTAHDPPAQAPRKEAGLFFPSQPSSKTNAYMMALGKGRLLTVDGCVRLEGAHGDSGDVVVWPPGYSLDRRDGEVLVLNEKGEVEARVGDEVEMGGGEISEDALAEKPEAQRRAFEKERHRYGVPGRCRGPLWVAAPNVRVLREG